MEKFIIFILINCRFVGFNVVRIPHKFIHFFPQFAIGGGLLSNIIGENCNHWDTIGQ